MSERKYTRCVWCGKFMKKNAASGFRRGQPYKTCSLECQKKHMDRYNHEWYVANVKVPKAVLREARKLVGFRAIERNRGKVSAVGGWPNQSSKRHLQRNDRTDQPRALSRRSRLSDSWA